MSSVHAANTETITLTESSRTLQQLPPAPDSPTGPESREADRPPASDGRSSDPEKMLQSASISLGAGEMAGDGSGLETVDASQQGSAETTPGGDDSQQWAEDESHELKRVKVYELIGARWVDQGTAFCFGDFQDNEALLIARAEADFNQIILSTTIRSSDVYQRQQDTLIVWTEPDGIDYALSFQDPEGCAEVWNFIQEVQRHMNTTESGISSSPTIGPEPSITTATIIRSGHLPTPTLGIIGEIDKAIKAIGRTPTLKERVCEYIQTEDYIKALIEVFRQAEDLESIDNLHSLFGLKYVFTVMLNDHSMYEHILEDNMFYGVVGMLEYDPEFPTHKANYREFLRGTTHFHQPIPIRDEAIQKKIHHTYRLQFLKDVVLARAIDDSTFNVLNSCILFNQIDIINHVQNDHGFLREVVEAEIKRRREVVSLIQQLCVMGKNVQLPARMALFRTLSDRGIVFAIQWALIQSENDEEGLQMISAAGEIMTALLDHDLNGVRGHVLKQITAMENEKAAGRNPENDTLVAVLCRILVKSRNLAVQSQIAESLRVLFEIPQGDAADPHSAMGAKMFQRAKDDPGVERFLDYFYRQCADVLFNPLFDLPDHKSHTDGRLTISRERTNLYLHLCELLASFALQHSFRSHFYVLSSNIASHVATLLSARDKHLRLAAFRYFRVLLRLNNRNIFVHLMKIDIFSALLDITIRESKRDNLLSSTCQEFFEFMRKDNIKEPIHHCMTKHPDKVKTLAEMPICGECFKGFIARWEINMEPPPKEEEKSDKTPLVQRRWGQGRLLEAEEEDYFNAPDEEEDSVQIINSSAFPKVGNSFKRKRVRGALGSLVDYDDGEEPITVFSAAEDSQGPSTSSPPAVSNRAPGSPAPQSVLSSPRISHRQISSPKTLISPTVGDFEDVLLENLVGGFNLPNPPASANRASEFAHGLGSKRRRDDDDDELLERLASKAKRPSGNLSPSPSKEKPSQGVTIKLSSAKPPEDATPKKIKLKLSPSSSSPTPSPSNTGAKDGDTG
ncbi:hypothetical protein EW026_g4525 [Hermanssonia centrifuga]|uniref:Uncharacterized protein n=1 Tax=Hermanssonia centrifuga TaxID=98765 RepID=A0A4S4KGV1_9APHY|nr:hypothetical protein EW026_g4525 [Hermanssonia centrifuga]